MFFCFAVTGMQVLGALAQMHPAAGRWSQTLYSTAASVASPQNLTGIRYPSVQLMHNRPFMADGLSRSQLFVAIPVKEGMGAGFAFAQTRLSSFRQNDLVLAAGKSLSRSWFTGVSFQYLGYIFPDRRKLRQWSSSVGCRKELKKWTVGGQAILSSPLIEGQSILKEIFLGVGSDFSPSLYTDISLHWKPLVGVSLETSIVYILLEQVFLAIQFETLPYRYAFEAGFRRKQWQVLLHGTRLPGIGWTPGLRLQFCGVSKKNSHE